MKNLLKIFIIGLVVCFSINSAWAISITGTPPQITKVMVGGTDWTAVVAPGLQASINNAFYGTAPGPDGALEKVQNELNKYGDQPDLAKGFANANAYAAQAATHQGFQDYTLFAVTTGVMVGVQLPSSDPDYYKDLDEKVKKDGDIYAGVAASWAILNAGINAGFIYPGLYLSAKFGYFSNDSLIDELSFKSTLLGIGANYTWIQSKSLMAGFIKWRGVSFGTGFIYNKTKIDLKIEPDQQKQAIAPINLAGAPYNIPGAPIVNGNVLINPTLELGIKSSTYTIPFDVTTSVRFLWILNFNLGAGVDFNFGSTDIKVKPTSTTYEDIPNPPTTPAVVLDATPGTMSIDASTKGKKPSMMRERITTGLGLNISVVKIDVPVIIYPFDSAFAVGLTVGVVY